MANVCASLWFVSEGILHDQSGKGESEDGRDVRQTAVDLCFRAIPIVVGQFGVTQVVTSRQILVGIRIEVQILPLVGEQFVGINALEFAGREMLHLLEFAS